MLPMRRLIQPVFAIAATLAGFGATLLVTIIICVLEVLLIPRLSPGAFYEGPANAVGRAAFHIAGLVGVIFGGYTAALLASRSGRSETGHAILVGVLFGLIGVVSNSGKAPGASEPVGIFLAAVLCAMIGGWVRVWRMWRKGLASSSR
jgi:hypothetical protein